MVRLFAWHKLRHRVLLLVLIAFVPAAILLIQNNVDRRRAETTRLAEETSRLVRLSVNEQRHLFEELRRVLASISAHPDLRPADPARCARLLSSLVLTNPLVYSSLVVADTKGDVFCSAKPLAGPLNLLDRPYIQDAMRTRGFTVSDYQIARLTRRPIVGFAHPVIAKDGRIHGVIALALGLDWFSDLPVLTQLPRGVEVIVVDRHSVVLAHMPDGGVATGQQIPGDAELSAAIDGGEDVVESVGLDGVRRLYGIAHIVSGRSRIATAVGMPLDVLHEADRTMYRGLAALGLIGLITIGLSWVGVRKFIVWPLDELRRATHSLASGDLSGRAVLTSGVAELDDVGADFDAMAWALQKREADDFLIREALKEAEEKYRHMVEQSLVGVYLVQGSQILYVNPRCAEIFGYTPEELCRKSLLDVVHESDRAMVVDNVARRMSGEVEMMEYSLRGVRKDGRPVSVHVHGARTDYQGKPAIMGIMLDRTDQKALEQQLLQAQKMEAVGRLAGGVAHDFNNLLTVITGYSEFLMQRLPESGEERGQVEEIHKAAESASNLTRQLLAFSRKQILQPEILSLNTIASGFDKMLRRLIGEDVKVTLALDPDLALTKVDPGQIEQVIMNLAVNARDAMPGGGTLTIQTGNVTLDHEYVRLHPGAQAGPHVMLGVSDTGTGMSPEIQARVFEPFFTTKERDRGTGLGLSTVYGIVRQSGGSIWLYSELGRGTTFKIFLPIADAAVVAETAAASEPRTAGGTETIIVVEDSASLRAWIAEALGHLGYTVIPLGTPGDALAMTASKNAPADLLVTDVILPTMNGAELAKRLQQRWPALGVLYMSGYTDEAIAPHGILPPGMTVLQKPFMAAALASRVRAALDERGRATTRNKPAQP